MLFPLLRRVSLLVCAFGVVVAVVFALVPVGTNFHDDPLLRLRQLDPELSPPDTAAVCGSPLRTFGSKSEQGASLYELAKSNACREAARRRLLVAVAAGGAIVMFGMVGVAAAGRHDPRRVGDVRYPLDEGDVGARRPENARSG